MIFCEENRRLLEQAIRNDAAIFPIAHHRKADGTLDVEGNLKVWLAAAKPFTKTYLWPEGAPGFDPEKTPLQERMYFAIEKNVKADTPPMFIWQTMSDDGRHGMCLAKALQDADVPYELHIFTQGVHGLAMADGHNDLGMDIPHVTHWGELCAEWLEEYGF